MKNSIDPAIKRPQRTFRRRFDLGETVNRLISSGLAKMQEEQIKEREEFKERVLRK